MNTTSEGSLIYAPMQLVGLSRGALANLVGVRLLRCVMPEKHSLTAAWTLYLESDGGHVLEFSTEPTHIGGWDEVGRLKVKAPPVIGAIDFPYPTRSWTIPDFTVSACAVLAYADHRANIESGLMFASEMGQRLVIAAGIPPGSVTVFLSPHAAQFQPECSIDEYKTYPLEQDAS